jgi:hypothetical protein
LNVFCFHRIRESFRNVGAGFIRPVSNVATGSHEGDPYRCELPSGRIKATPSMKGDVKYTLLPFRIPAYFGIQSVTRIAPD